MKQETRRRGRFLAGFGVYFVALWLLWNTPVAYPLKLFVVLLHESSHGLVAVATGGRIEGIVLTSDQGGLCRCPGGNAFLTLSAGYLGSLAWGALIVRAALLRGTWARASTGVLGAGALIVSALYLRNGFGLAFGLAFGAALVGAARYLNVEANRVLLNVLGLTSCLYAILDIKSDILERPHLTSDAAMLAGLTGIPTLVWGILWIGIALFASWRLFRWAYRRA
ncbi:MAG: M50 family metallopeptidase [Gemmatimonadota bacterium]